MLSLNEAVAFYNKFEVRQDKQAFFEDPATDLLVKHARFEEATSVFELGAGTGRFAEKLLFRYLPKESTYFGVDVSPTMVGLAKDRLQRFGNRATVELHMGSGSLSKGNGPFDRFVSNYVLDLLSDDDTMGLIEKAHDILRPEGLLCLVSLTSGRTFFTRAISSIWSAVFAINAKLVGGCRPIELGNVVSREKWTTEHLSTVSAFGITSEVLIARKLK